MASYIGVSPPEQTGIVERYKYTGNGSATAFSGADTNAKVLRYTSTNPVLVFLNGVQLVEGTDFTKTSNTVLTFTSAPANNDEIEILTFGSFNLNSPATIRCDLGLNTTDSPTFNGLTTTGNINLGDDDVINVGAGNDLQISHDGTQSIIKDAGTGQLKILAENTLFFGSATGNAKYISGIKNGKVDLSYSNSVKLETTSTGATITGALVSDGLTVDTNTLHVDATNNRVGILNASPEVPLHVKGSILRIESNSVSGRAIDLDADSGSVEVNDNSTWLHLQRNHNGQVAVGSGSTANLYVPNNAGFGAVPATDSKVVITHNSVSENTLHIQTTENSSSAGPIINLKRNSSSPADADYLGQLKFKGENDADQEVTYAKITAKIDDASDGTEDGLIEFANIKAGSQTITARLKSDKLQLLNGVGLEVAGDATITGDLTINGTTTTLNTATLDIEDKTLCIAKGAADAAAANGAGIIVDGASACLTYGNTNDDWTFNKSLNVTGDSNKLTVCSSDYLMAVICPRGGTGANLDRPVLKMFTDGTNEKIRLDSVGCSFIKGGNLGIGTTAPTQDLDILNASGSNIVLRDTSNRALVMCGPATGVSPSIGTTGTGSNLLVVMNGTNKFTFTSAGCLGVNNTNPLFGMHVCNGTIGFDDGTAIRHRIKSIGNQIGFGRCTLEAASSDCGNLAFGSGALQCNDVGQYNVAMGYQAMFNTNSAAGSYNTAHGYQALLNNTTGEKNTAIGYHSMYANTTGEYNAAIGTDSLRANTTGQQNVALGHNSLYNNTVGFGQVAAGYKSLFNNTTGNYNVGLGAYNLEANVSGSCNVAIGYKALNLNTCSSNVAVGYQALRLSVTGTCNVAIGHAAGESIHAGSSDNVFIGLCAGKSAGSEAANCSQNVMIGVQAGSNASFSRQTVNIGYQANQYNGGTSNISIGYQAGLYNKGGTNVFIGQSSGVGLSNGTSTGSSNVAMGHSAMKGFSTGNGNVALGVNAMMCVTTGCDNVSLGLHSLCAITTGCRNVALGRESLRGNTTGSFNVAVGYHALACNTTGQYNVALGFHALKANTTANYNVGVGYQALEDNTTGEFNVAIGYGSLRENTVGKENTALGYYALRKTTTGIQNVAIGKQAMVNNLTGSCNVAIGKDAMTNAVSANQNVAIGTAALYANAMGHNNVAIGTGAMSFNTTGQKNVAIGVDTMRCNTVGCSNIAIGEQSLYCNTTGNLNVALGTTSLYANTTGCSNVAIGSCALSENTTGSNNIAIGTCAYCSGTTGINNIAIGNKAMTGYAGGGSCNTVLGIAAMQSPETCGSNNTALGFAAALKGASNTVAIGASALRNVGCAGCGSHTNVAMGGSAGCLLTRGCRNVFIGFTAAECSVHGTAGSSIDDNVAVGNGAMRCNINGHDQVAVGAFALSKGGSGSNVAVGANAGEQLSSLTSGGSYGNIAMGTNSLKCAVTACWNVAIGWGALFAGDSTDTFNSQHNIAIGCYALRKNQTGGCSVAIGGAALLNNTIGCRNVAIGHLSMANNTTGCFNTAIGYESACSNTVGLCNVSMGYQSLRNATTACQNIAIGHQALCKTEQNAQIAIGTCAAMNNTTGSQNTVLGHFAFRDNTTGNFNIAVGNLALDSNTTGVNNVAIGYQANTSAVTAINVTAIGCRALCNNLTSTHVGIGANALLKNTTGINNVAIGVSSLSCNTTGGCNLAIGSTALRHNTTGCNNIAIGNQALEKQTTASNNVTVGGMAGACTTTGSDNVVMGSRALCANTTGACNTAIGRESLRNNTTGHGNTAVGYRSLHCNTTGINNTAVGVRSQNINVYGIKNTSIGEVASGNNTVGNHNVAVGYQSLLSNAGGSWNTSVGTCALYTSLNLYNTAVGGNAGKLQGTQSAKYNIYLGYNAGCDLTTGAGNVIIGTVQPDSNTGNRQLKIAGYDGSSTTTWIKGDSSGNLIVAGTVTANGQLLSAVTKPTISSISPTVVTNAQTAITITGANFVSIPQVEFLNPSTGIYYLADSVAFSNSTSITVTATLPVDGTYKIRIENGDGEAVLSGSILTVSDTPTFSTAAGSLGTFEGGFSGTIATISASSDSTIAFSETTNVLSGANVSLNTSTGALTTTDLGGSSTTPTTYNFTLRATDGEGQTADRSFSITTTFGAQGGAQFN